MKVMMLPEVSVKEKFEILTECEECRKLEKISFRVENLLICVEREEEIFTEESKIALSLLSFLLIIYF